MGAKNWMCDGDKCQANGKVRLYPTGGGGNMIYCQACAAAENRYRFERNNPEAFPQVNWFECEVYEGSK